MASGIQGKGPSQSPVVHHPNSAISSAPANPQNCAQKTIK